LSSLHSFPTRRSSDLGAGFGAKGLGTSFWYGAGIGIKLGKAIDAELRYTGWKQQEVITNHGTAGGYGGTGGTGGSGTTGGGYGRSEEHTSELQSRFDL